MPSAVTIHSDAAVVMPCTVSLRTMIKPAPMNPTTPYSDTNCGSWNGDVWTPNGNCPNVNYKHQVVAGTITSVKGHLVTLQQTTGSVVIDDSAYNRQTITQMLESDPDVRVVARAADGDEGLKLVFQHQPDIVTLDLEMPKMDGFTFLRILMSRRATPVLSTRTSCRGHQSGGAFSEPRFRCDFVAFTLF